MNLENSGKVYIHKGDAKGEIRFYKRWEYWSCCTHPPYANIIGYSEDIDEDLSFKKYLNFWKKWKK